MDSNQNVELTTRVPGTRARVILLRKSLDHERESHERVQAALRESEERFEMIAEYIPQLVWTTRPDGYHEYFNRRWLTYTGMTLEQTRGWDWSHLLHPDDRERTFSDGIIPLQPANRITWSTAFCVRAIGPTAGF